MVGTIRNIENNTELDVILNKKYTVSVRTGYVEVGEDNVCLPVYYRNYEEKIRKFEVRDDDVFLVALPKTGTTWCQEMIWLLVNNLDYESAKQHHLQRFPLLELPILYDFNIMKLDELKGEHPWTHVENLKSPRCLKSHLPWSLLPEQIRNGSKQPKIISVLRNPKDTCVSYYHYSQLSSGFKGTFEEFTRLYLGGRVPYGPHWKHVLGIWQQKHRPNILIIKYEDMKADLPTVIKKVADFLEKPLAEADIATLVDHLCLAAMKNNPSVNYNDVFKKLDRRHNLTVAENDFIRVGKVGGYKSMMTPEISAKFDAWTAENLVGTDFDLY